MDLFDDDWSLAAVGLLDAPPVEQAARARAAALAPAPARMLRRVTCDCATCTSFWIIGSCGSCLGFTVVLLRGRTRSHNIRSDEGPRRRGGMILAYDEAMR